VEGIFRMSGNITDITELKAKLDNGDPVKITDCEPHALTGLFKLFLRELPEVSIVYFHLVYCIGYHCQLDQRPAASKVTMISNTISTKRRFNNLLS
jgi:hypothetical protein